MRDGFHLKRGLYFKRIWDGAVRIEQADENDEVQLAVECDASEWASVVAYLSARGKTGETLREALNLHHTAEE